MVPLRIEDCAVDCACNRSTLADFDFWDCSRMGEARASRQGQLEKSYWGAEAKNVGDVVAIEKATS